MGFRAVLVAAAAFAGTIGASFAVTTKPLPPLPLPERVVAAPNPNGSFDFIVGGDNRPAAQGEPMPPSTAEIFTEIGLIRPRFVIWTGDAIEGYGDTAAQADAEYASFLGLAALAQTPIYDIPGNHEIGFDPELVDEYRAKMGPTYGSFDYDGCHFIGLDSTPVEADGKIHEGDIDPKQLAWLEADLAANRDAANVFVFFHHYMYGPAETPTSPDTGLADAHFRDRLAALFVKYHVRAVFNGHQHQYYHIRKDGIDYYIAGNAGAPLDAPPQDGGFLGYMLVHVDGKTITTQTLTPWTILTRTVIGNDGVSPTAKIAVSTYEFGALTLRGITADMPAATSYTVTASSPYKKKVATTAVRIVSSVPGPTGSVIVTVAGHFKAHRTTYVTVTASG